MGDTVGPDAFVSQQQGQAGHEVRRAIGKLDEQLGVDMDRAFTIDHDHDHDHAQNPNRYLTDVARTFVDGASREFPPPLADKPDGDEVAWRAKNQPRRPGGRVRRYGSLRYGLLPGLFNLTKLG